MTGMTMARLRVRVTYKWALLMAMSKRHRTSQHTGLELGPGSESIIQLHDAVAF